MHQVDHAINVLISAGLSSPALRACAEKGVEIEGAGHAESAIPLVFLGPQQLGEMSRTERMRSRKVFSTQRPIREYTRYI